jgi:hypothetical protein
MVNIDIVLLNDFPRGSFVSEGLGNCIGYI